MDKHRLVLLEPGVQRLPREVRGAAQRPRRPFSPDPRSPRTDLRTDLQRVTVRGSGTELLRVLVVEEHTVHQVLDRDAELGVGLPFPYVQRAAGVEGDPAADHSPDAAGYGLDVPDRDDETRVQDTFGCHGDHLVFADDAIALPGAMLPGRPRLLGLRSSPARALSPHRHTRRVRRCRGRGTAASEPGGPTGRGGHGPHCCRAYGPGAEEHVSRRRRLAGLSVVRGTGTPRTGGRKTAAIRSASIRWRRGREPPRRQPRLCWRSGPPTIVTPSS